MPLNNASVSAELCLGETIILYGEEYDSPGTYIDTITGSAEILIVKAVSQLPSVDGIVSKNVPGVSYSIP